MVACATISLRVRQAGYTSAASVPNAARELLAASPMSVPPGLSELLQEAWTIQVGFVRKWIFSFQTPSPGTKWNRQLGNTTCIRRRPRTRKPQFACEPLTNQSLGTCFAHLERRPGPMKMLVGGSAGAAKIKKIANHFQSALDRRNCFGGQCRCRQKHDCSMRSLLLITFGIRRSLIKRSLFCPPYALTKLSSVLLRSSLLAYRSLALPSQVR
jgi:hypothetical protein